MKSNRSSRVGLAIIGSTGAIGGKHLDAIGQLDSCELIGVHARRAEPLKSQADSLGVRSYQTLSEVFGDSDVDAVVIATPHPSHRDIALKAFEASRHVLVEKPMAVTPSEADDMIEGARASRMHLGVLFNNRFRPEALKMHDLINKGVVGKIYRATMTSAMFRSQDYYDRLDWRGTWDREGGGALINQGIHAVDMFLWLTGMPQGVFGAIRTLKHDIEVEDYASAILEYEDGVLGTINCDTVQAPNRQRIEIYGENGALIMEDWNVILHRLKTPLQEFLEQDKTAEFVAPETQIELSIPSSSTNTHAPAIDDFCRSILGGRPPLVTGEEGAKSQEVVAAITLSGCRGEKVPIPVDRKEYDELVELLRHDRRLPSSI